MLKIGRQTKAKIIDKAKKDDRKFILQTLHSFSKKYPAKHDKMTKRFKLIINNSADRGFEKPTTGNNSFINNPKNIKNATLNPTESRIISARLSFSNLRNLKMRMPGIKVR